MQGRKGISSFSVLLIMAVASVVGIACVSMLKVQYTPPTSSKSLTVSFSYPGASARIVEAEATSKLEGVLSTLSLCSGISSYSGAGYGRISVKLPGKSDMQAVRFEAASLIRNIYSRLPEACSYPSISINEKGENPQAAITFNVRSSLPSQRIAKYIEDGLLHPLSTIDGVNSVSFHGQTPYEWVITYDADIASSLGISADMISSSILDYYKEEDIGVCKDGDNTVSVKIRNASSSDMAAIPVRNVDGRIVHLGDLATFRYQEALPDSYYRINALNVLNLTVEASSDANLITVVNAVKEKLSSLTADMPEEIGISVGYDYSEYISKELNKIISRTLLCLAILLLFVLLAGRSWRYLLVIFLTLLVNILISISLYLLLGVNIHIYTLAGITVSLGIVIDNSIVMIDHYTRNRSRSVFPSLLTAVLTTVVALSVIFLLPDSERANLADFSLVIIINLGVSLLVSYLFVPALLDYLPVKDRLEQARKDKLLRRTARWNSIYSSYIAWGARHKWVYVLVLILAFGIPTCLIPQEKAKGWKAYSDHRATIDKIAGSSFYLFHKALSRADFYREPTRPNLSVKAGLPEGCTVHQLNEVIKEMENYLTSFEEIEVFTTRISSYDNALISISFKPEYENTTVPSAIKSEIISMASNLGGANWTVSGLDENYFNNNIVSDYRSNRIDLSGYNYEELLKYCGTLVDYLGRNRRVSSPEIWGSGYWDSPNTEFSIQYDFEKMSALGISPYEYHSALLSQLYDSQLMRKEQDGEYVRVRLESSNKESFDAWSVRNAGIEVPSGQALIRTKLPEVGSINKSRSELPVQKENQAYKISVRYDFLGPYQLSRMAADDAVEYMNTSVLPLGFTASSASSGWFYDNQDKYAGLILLVIALIFVVCATFFNSLRMPLAVILMVPISFIGVFLTFGLSDFVFDKGGFAAFVMLSGITVNAGIYLLSEWKSGSVTKGNAVRRYCKAFNRKIWPISLTILSTVLGLVPFLFDGPSEVFWFPFSIGTISGLLFSFFALVLYLPVFAVKVRDAASYRPTSRKQGRRTS